MTTIMLVDDHPVLRKGIIQLIELEEGLEVICEASNGQQAIERALELSPDLILLDLNMKGIDGIQTMSRLKRSGSVSKTIIYTVSDNETDIVAAIKGGVDGYILKDTEPEELIEQIKRAVNGEFIISEPLAPMLAHALRPVPHERNIMKGLTNREREIWHLVSQGKSNKEIGRQLKIAETTVKVHVKNLLKKIKMRTRIEAALYAVEKNLFP